MQFECFHYCIISSSILPNLIRSPNLDLTFVLVDLRSENLSVQHWNLFNFNLVIVRLEEEAVVEK